MDCVHVEEEEIHGMVIRYCPMRNSLNIRSGDYVTVYGSNTRTLTIETVVTDRCNREGPDWHAHQCSCNALVGNLLLWHTDEHTETIHLALHGEQIDLNACR